MNVSKPVALLYTLALAPLSLAVVVGGVTVAPPDAAACSPEPQMPVFPREGTTVPRDVVVQALDWGEGQEAAELTFGEWALVDDEGTAHELELSVIDGRVAQLRPSNALPLGAYTLHAPRFNAWEDDITFTVVDEFARELSRPDIEPSNQFVFHEDSSIDCGSLGTYQSFTRPSESYALRVMATSPNLSELQHLCVVVEFGVVQCDVCGRCAVGTRAKTEALMNRLLVRNLWASSTPCAAGWAVPAEMLLTEAL